MDYWQALGNDVLMTDDRSKYIEPGAKMWQTETKMHRAVLKYDAIPLEWWCTTPAALKILEHLSAKLPGLPWPTGREHRCECARGTTAGLNDVRLWLHYWVVDEANETWVFYVKNMFWQFHLSSHVLSCNSFPISIWNCGIHQNSIKSVHHSIYIYHPLLMLSCILTFSYPMIVCLWFPHVWPIWDEPASLSTMGDNHQPGYVILKIRHQKFHPQLCRQQNSCV